MLHRNLDNGNHWAVGYTGIKLPDAQCVVLVQLQENGNQVRVTLTPKQAEDMAFQLKRYATLAHMENSNKSSDELMAKIKREVEQEHRDRARKNLLDFM